jgi:hypothetical protein
VLLHQGGKEWPVVFKHLVGRTAVGLAALGLVAMGSAAEVRGFAAAAELCPPGTPRDSLCNVEPELRRAYLAVERVGDLPYTGERIAALVRERRVRIEWDWADANPYHLGQYRAAAGQVAIAAHLRGQPDRVEAAVLAHELWHAYAGSHNLFPATAAGCLEDEKAAFMVGAAYYNRLLHLAADKAPRSEVDARMQAIDREWLGRGGAQADLDTLADEHLAANGYLQRCSRYQG